MTAGVTIAMTSGLIRTGGLSYQSSWRVTTAKPVTYDVEFRSGILDPDDSSLVRAGGVDAAAGGRRLVVMERRIQELYGDAVSAYFDAHGVASTICLLDTGEQAKSVASALLVVAAMDRFGISRRSEPIIAIGGGVLTDIVGFAASLYRRSTPYVRVPSTLIGMVDAAIGAKTGVNHDGKKNRLGSYHPSTTTLIDCVFLRTLDRRHISNGLAEVLKMAMVADSVLFDLVAEHGPRLIDERLQPVPGSPSAGVAAEVVYRAVDGMLTELQPNLWEEQLHRCVDYGHSFSPAIEMQALPDLLHGEAVAIDMACTTILARRRGLISAAEDARIFGVLSDLELPVWHRVCRLDLMTAALADVVRHRNGRQRMPLLDGIGKVRFVDDVSVRELQVALAELAERASLTSGYPA